MRDQHRGRRGDRRQGRGDRDRARRARDEHGEERDAEHVRAERRHAPVAVHLVDRVRERADEPEHHDEHEHGPDERDVGDPLAARRHGHRQPHEASERGTGRKRPRDAQLHQPGRDGDGPPQPEQEGDDHRRQGERAHSAAGFVRDLPGQLEIDAPEERSALRAVVLRQDERLRHAGDCRPIGRSPGPPGRGSARWAARPGASDR